MNKKGQYTGSLKMSESVPIQLMIMVSNRLFQRVNSLIVLSKGRSSAGVVYYSNMSAAISSSSRVLG